MRSNSDIHTSLLCTAIIAVSVYALAGMATEQTHDRHAAQIESARQEIALLREDAKRREYVIDLQAQYIDHLERMVGGED